MNIDERTPTEFPPQAQSQDEGKEYVMNPEPYCDAPWYKGADKLKNKVALITGGDSGIGRSVAVLFAREGADITIIYKENHKDAEKAKQLVEKEGRKCLIIAGDVTKKSFCEECVQKTISTYGKLDCLVNNAAFQEEQNDVLAITEEQLDKTFKTNIYAYFYMAQVAIPHMKPQSTIINTTSVTAYKGSGHLLDYSSTKGAIRTFTYSLSEAMIEKGIRVNGVAPGPIWTPFIPSTFDPEKVSKFGQQVPMKRAGQPEECATCYVFLASRDSAYLTGQILHPNGGTIVNA